MARTGRPREYGPAVARIVAEKVKHGASAADIVAELGISRATVYRLLRQAKEHRMNTGFDITNEDRGELALVAVQAFADRTNQADHESVTVNDLRKPGGWMAGEIVGDLLGDLLHLLTPEIFDEALRCGRNHYNAEHCKTCGGTAEDYGVCDACGKKQGLI